MSDDDKAKSEDDRAKSEDDKAKFALEYLKLARGEILEKAKVVNQTLGAYLAGSAALASWFYQGLYKPVGQGVSAPAELEKMLAASAFAVMISYLAFTVNWIIYHNERIIVALATYQKDDLDEILGNDPPIWERSAALARFDSPLEARKMALVESRIVLAPPVMALLFACWCAGFAYWKVGFANWWPDSLLAVPLLVLALFANLATRRDGGKMRENAGNLRGRHGVPAMHPRQTQHNR